jgi:hypothetical protein
VPHLAAAGGARLEAELVCWACSSAGVPCLLIPKMARARRCPRMVPFRSRSLTGHYIQDSIGVLRMTTGAPCFAESDAAFSELTDTVRAQVEPGNRLPDWPFTAATGYVTIYEYDLVLGSSFGLVLENPGSRLS